MVLNTAAADADAHAAPAGSPLPSSPCALRSLSYLIYLCKTCRPARHQSKPAHTVRRQGPSNHGPWQQAHCCQAPSAPPTTPHLGSHQRAGPAAGGAVCGAWGMWHPSDPVPGQLREGGLQQQARDDVGVHVGGRAAVLQVALVLDLRAQGTRTSHAGSVTTRRDLPCTRHSTNGPGRRV